MSIFGWAFLGIRSNAGLWLVPSHCHYISCFKSIFIQVGYNSSTYTVISVYCWQLSTFANFFHSWVKSLCWQVLHWTKVHPDRRFLFLAIAKECHIHCLASQDRVWMPLLDKYQTLQEEKYGNFELQCNNYQFINWCFNSKLRILLMFELVMFSL